VTKALEEARQARSALDRGAADRKVADAEQAYRNSVNRSQLHSFTAMVYGVDPIDVTDAQVHAFLRIFVFVPALCAAFASTILALCAVSVRKTFMDEDDLGATVDPAATPYMLDSITDALRQEIGLAQPKPPREANVASGEVIPIDRRPAGQAAIASNLPASAGAGA
jgi:hypothetical protein